MRIYLLFLSTFIWVSPILPASAWVVVENGARRPVPVTDGDVSSQDLPAAVRSAMRVDAVSRTVEWTGDRGRLKAARGERIVVKNGHARMLSRPVRFEEVAVKFPAELLTDLLDLFSFVDVAGGEEIRIADPSMAPPPPAAIHRVQTVVMDPGHGGSDPGARGKAGAVEKDIALAIGIEAAQALRGMDPSLNIVLTRSTDEFVSLQDRARIANTRRGDLFVSIHANSVKRNSDAGGFEVYHLDIEGANDDARALAAIENAVPHQNAATSRPNGALQQILGDVMQVQYLNGSIELSRHISDALTAALEGASKFRGSKGAFFYVLKDVMAPAVLVEVGFVTNEWEASFLQKPWYQRKIAGGIANGILNFKRLELQRLGQSTVPSPDEAPSPATGP
ncbi:N-acetylmuramoyl-L-alanine amidase [bacterium]|nr:N-acetylmuramoyl-L-alanine amidase [bacterium]